MMANVHRKWLLVAAVFLLCFLRFSFHIQGDGIASGFVDPVSRIPAQDEAVYSRIALNMPGRDCLTPMFLGRYALFKPPLLYWLSGASAKLLGPSNFSLRLPSLIAGSVVATLAFAWALDAGVGPAFLALMLLLSNPLLHTLSRLNLTDSLLAALVAVAAYCLKRDPVLSEKRFRWIFAVAGAAAIMTKAVAGVLVLLLLLLFACMPVKALRPRPTIVVRVLLLAIALAVPWHLYQLAVHPAWFWSEYVIDEHFRAALSPLSQTSAENQAVFYLKRWALIDPVLLVAFLVSLPPLLRALWKRSDPEAYVLGCWIALQTFAILAFSYRNVAYLLPLVVPCAIAATRYGFTGRRWPLRIALALVVAASVLRTANPSQPWGLAFPAESQTPSARALDRYAALHRKGDLIVVQPDDEFYATVLPLSRVRYAYLSDGRRLQKPAMDFHQLGITVTVDDFLALDRLRPQYLERLRQFGLDSEAPLASVIEFRSDEEIGKLIAGAQNCDFYLPERFRQLPSGAHSATGTAAGRFFLMAAY